jgi:hypothetical protein
MRRSILLLLLPLACGEPPGEVYVVVENFLERAAPASCEAISVGSVAVSEIRAATDSTWLLLDEPQRRIVEISHDFRTLWSLEYPSAGPGSLLRPVSVALLGDTAVAVADQGSLKLVVLTRAGDQLLSTPLGFLPNAIASTPSGQVLVTPMPFGGSPGTLLVRFDGRAPEELPVPARYYEDMMVRAIGNVAIVETLPDGGALVVHQYLAPRGFLVDPDGVVTRLAVPTPDATAAHIDYIPTAPVTEEQQPLIMLPAAAMSVDPLRSEVYIMTRSGRTVQGVAERAILRLDDRLGFIEAFTVGIAAHEMAFLPRRGIALVVDDSDRIFACALPLTGDRDAQAE